MKMNPASFDYSGVTPYIDLAASRKHMSIPKPNSTTRKYPQISIPSHSLNRISKLPSPQRRSCRNMAAASDDSGNAVLMNQILQQQQQQQQHQYQYWNTQLSTSDYHHRQQRQAAAAAVPPPSSSSSSASCRPSSWHCPTTLEPFPYMTPVSAIPPSYPCNSSSNPTSNISSKSSNNSNSSITKNNSNNNFSVSYSASVSPEISSSPLLSPTYTITTDSLLSQGFGSPLHLYSNPAILESNCLPPSLTDKPWILDHSLPQNNCFVHSHFTQDDEEERDNYLQWNLNTPFDHYLLETNCSLTSPPTPNDTAQGRHHTLGQPYLVEKCVSSHSLANNQTGEEELIGMGLYDGPESQKSPLFHHSSLDHVTEVQGIKFIHCLAGEPGEPQGKGLKLEETFTPTLSDDDSVTDDGDDYENGSGG